MAEIAILLTAYFFGAIGYLVEHWWITLPVMVALWLLLFVPAGSVKRVASTFAARRRTVEHTPRPAEPVRTRPVREPRVVREPQPTH